MTSLSRSTAIRFLVLGVLILAAVSSAQTRPPIAEQIAKAYGLDSFGQIEAIRYTWNGELQGVFKVSRSWEWNAKTNTVSYQGMDKDGKPVKVTYMRSQLSSQSDAVKNQVDPEFINDNYWLIFPFHACWDTSATVTDQGMHKLPLGKGSARLVAVKYPPEAGGYTPGDTWELYVGNDNRVEQFVYRRSGAKPIILTATWTGYKKAGPLVISTEHQGTTADGKRFHLTISDISVKLTGSDKWIKAQ